MNITPVKSCADSDFPSSREEARALGVKHYMTGKPCKNGHIGLRFTSVGSCMQCNLEFALKRRHTHADDVLACKRASYQKNKASALEKFKEYRVSNRASILETKKKYRVNNPEKVAFGLAAYGRMYPERIAAHKAKRRAAKRQAIPLWFSEFDEFVFVEAHDLRIKRTKATNILWHVDHLYPLASGWVCGLHVGTNVRVIPAITNLQKGNRANSIVSGWSDFL